VVHAFALELLWIFSHPNERRGTPSFGHCYYPGQTTTNQRQKVIWFVYIAQAPSSSTYLCAPRLSISLTLDLIAVPPSPTSPSPTQAPSMALMQSRRRLIMYRHVCTAFFRFPFVNLAHLISRFLIAFFPDDALNPPSPPLPLPRRHVFAAGILCQPPPSFFLFFQTPPAVHYYLYTTDNRTKLLAEHVKHVHNASDSQRNNNSNPSYTH